MILSKKFFFFWVQKKKKTHGILCLYLLNPCVDGLLYQFIILGAVPFPADVLRLKELGVSGVVTLNESYETLVPTSVYHVSI